MNDYEKGMTDALAILQAEVQKRCDLLDKMVDALRIPDGPHLADNDMSGMINAQRNLYQGVKISFETAMMRKISELRRKK